jgi:hypothetical protein
VSLSVFCNTASEPHAESAIPLPLDCDLLVVDDTLLSRRSESLQTHRWGGVDSNLYGAFPVKWCFSVYCQFFVRRLKGPVFIPSPTIRFPERAQWGQGSETLAKLAA